MNKHRKPKSIIPAPAWSSSEATRKIHAGRLVTAWSVQYEPDRTILLHLIENTDVTSGVVKTTLQKLMSAGIASLDDTIVALRRLERAGVITLTLSDVTPTSRVTIRVTW